MPEYRLNTEDWLWSAYKATVSHEQTLDEPIRKQIAERVAASDRVDDDDRRRAQQLLEEDPW